MTAPAHSRPGHERRIAALRDRVDGQVLTAGEPGYDEARSVWNALVDRRPRLIVRCAGTGDVVAAVRAARSLGLEIGVRCGGHSAVGYAVPEDGLMIDLTPMGAVTVDPDRSRAWVQGGALLGALDRATQPYGLATTAGNVSHTGVGGLTLGGGMGWLARQYGLSCDNVMSYSVVTAEGSVVRTSASEHPDLFWGLRGGGGNFGVVTEFEFRLHDTGTQALSVELDFPIEAAATVLRGWRDLTGKASREATFTAFVDGDRLIVGYVWVGDPDMGRQLLPSLRTLGPAVAERVDETSYLSLQSRGDSDRLGVHAMRRYSGGHYFRALTDEVIDVMLAAASPGGFAPAAGLQAYGGAIADVADADSAFSHRDAAFELNVGVGWDDPAEDDERIAAARTFIGALTPFASGVYGNRAEAEVASDDPRIYSADKLARLTALKDAYDPDNVFHLNQNIAPSR
jgi:FAD/FMN-containing dehydrogenase